jgi:hypothetical protein
VQRELGALLEHGLNPPPAAPEGQPAPAADSAPTNAEPIAQA